MAEGQRQGNRMGCSPLGQDIWILVAQRHTMGNRTTRLSLGQKSRPRETIRDELARLLLERNKHNYLQR